MTKVKKITESKTVRFFGNGADTINRLRMNEEDFTVVKTSKTTNIKTETMNYLYAEKHYFGKIFGMLATLKSQITKNAQKVYDAPYSGNYDDVKYFEFNKSFKTFNIDTGSFYEIPDVIEADITSAYYRGIFNLGFIDKPFYEKCINLKKIDRLILIGSIATVKTIEVYEKGIVVDTQLIKDDLLRMAWFKICSYVDAALLTLKSRLDLISKDIFLFYWVDGIYFRDFEAPNYTWHDVFKELSEVFHFDWKYQKLKMVKVLNMGTHLKIELTKRNGEKKEFFPSQSEIKLYCLDKTGKPLDVYTDMFNPKIIYK